MRDPVPSFRLTGRMMVAALVLFLAAGAVCAVFPDAARAAQGGAARYVPGYVERNSGHAIQVRGKWYELAGARVVDPENRPLRSQDIKVQAYVQMQIVNDRVKWIQVYQGLLR